MVTAEKASIHFLNTETVLNNMKALVEYQNIDNNKSLKENYFDVLNRLQNINIPFETEKILIKFEADEIYQHFLKKDFLEKEDLEGNKHMFSTLNQKTITSKINQSLTILSETNQGLHYAIHQLLGTLICFKKFGQGGGSTSCALGLIWLNPQKNWTPIDYAENIYHEYIHNSIFVDDMVNQIFVDLDKCREEESLVNSAILKIKRPFDLAFHAAGVAVGLTHLYLKLNDRQKALSYIKPLKESLYQMKEKDFCLTPHGKESLEGMIYFTETLDWELIDNHLVKF